MLYTSAVAAVAAFAPLVSAHGSGIATPRIVGLNPRDLKARDLLSSLGARFADVKEFAKYPENQVKHVKPRQDDRQCGAGIGSCPAGQCCSSGGYCGTDPDYCYSPGCDYEHGPGCPENVTPAGTNTSSIPRTKVGSVPYGGDGIYNCVTPGTVAITYDDGPQKAYTAHILDVLATYNAKATFFITGNNINKGEIDTTQEFIDVIKRADAAGHQIASHTWTHLDLSAISQKDRLNQMWKNEMALRNILGKIPTYMRPPYSSCTGQCETDMADLGYHVTYFDVDTDDYEHDDPTLIQSSKDWFKGNITKAGSSSKTSAWLEIGHDIHQQTAYNLTDYMLNTLTSLGYRGVTVGECLGDPQANWYRTAGGAGTVTSTKSSSAPATSATHKVTTDATCGGANGYTCLGSTFGNCCSSAGYCGSTTAYCGTGCQSAFGNCGSNSAPVSSAKATSTAASAPAPSASSAKKVSTDATCGGANGYTCQGSTFGNCCSSAGYCGSTTAYCGTGCQSGFGTCGTNGAVSSAKPATTIQTSTKNGATPTPTPSKAPAKTPSNDGTCGGSKGFTCTGSTFGKCCSQYGWCGSDTAFCGTGCNKSFGTCN